jgi:LysR family hydrogen peroxide-inducible transcriptional activator
MASPNDITIRQLQYAVAVGETLGFRKAAERCHVSQPSLSAQVALLEDVLGVQLFERNRRRVLVTAGGEVVLAHARRVLVGVDDLLAEAERLADPLAGRVRIGVIPTAAPYLLPEVVPPARKQYPNLQLLFREEKTERILAELREGHLDAGLLALEADIGAWATAPITRDAFVVALPKGHALARRKRISPRDFAGVTVRLLDDGHCFRAQALSVCTRAGAQEAEMRATSLATLVQMVSAGDGITLLPQLAVPVENRRGQLEIRPFAPPAPGRALALVWRPQSPLGGALRALAAAFRAALDPAAKATGPRR